MYYFQWLIISQPTVVLVRTITECTHAKFMTSHIQQHSIQTIKLYECSSCNTETVSPLKRSLSAIVPRLAATLLQQLDVRYLHTAINRLAHVINCGKRKLHADQRFHLDTGL